MRICGSSGTLSSWHGKRTSWTCLLSAARSSGSDWDGIGCFVATEHGREEAWLFLVTRYRKVIELDLVAFWFGRMGGVIELD